MSHIAAALQSQGVSATAVPWTLDTAHTNAHFTVRHMMISNVRGEFSNVSGNVLLDPSDVTRSRVDVEIETASLSTRDEKRDAHLRSADFFDAEKHPKITFRSNRIVAKGEGESQVTGDLTIHGVTREITFAVEGPTPVVKDPWGNLRIGVTATAKINRKDFGLVWNALVEGGGVLVGEEVRIELDAELVRTAEQKAGA
jgi:polyisoprenoid-binding protein YceI